MTLSRYAKRSVRYTPTHGNSNEWCAKCKFFRHMSKSCAVVIGPIDPEGWCMKFLDKQTGGSPQ